MKSAAKDVETLKKQGYRVIQVVEGQHPSYEYVYGRKRNDDWYPNYPLTKYEEEAYRHTFKTVHVNHQLIAGHENTYVTLLTEHDVEDLDRMKQEFKYMKAIIDESNQILQQSAREKKIRDTNQGVEEAYQHYKFLLSLTK